MQNLQHILVPTDFSEGASHALIYALNLAEQISANLYILHVKKENEDNHEVTPCFDDIRYRYFFKRKTKPVFKTREGDVHEGILKEIHDSKIDLVILGMSRKLGIREMMFGSLTAKLIDKPPCALIAVPEDNRNLDLKHVAIATDYQSLVNPPEFYVVKYLIDAFRSRVDIFHVIKEQEVIHDFSQEVRAGYDQLFKYNFHAYDEIEGEGLLRAIGDYTKDNTVDLLVVLHHKVGPHTHKRSVSKQLAFTTSLPLLIIPIK